MYSLGSYERYRLYSDKTTLVGECELTDLPVDVQAACEYG